MQTASWMTLKANSATSAFYYLKKLNLRFWIKSKTVLRRLKVIILKMGDLNLFKKEAWLWSLSTSQGEPLRINSDLMTSLKSMNLTRITTLKRFPTLNQSSRKLLKRRKLVGQIQLRLANRRSRMEAISKFQKCLRKQNRRLLSQYRGHSSLRKWFTLMSWFTTMLKSLSLQTTPN